MKNIELTETGFLTLIGMIMTFAVACCRGIQQSRCNNISSPCIKCERQVLNDETLLEMRKMEEGEEKKDNNKN